MASDSTGDLMAGTRAGATVVARLLTGAHSRVGLDATPPTHLVNSIAQFPRISSS